MVGLVGGMGNLGTGRELGLWVALSIGLYVVAAQLAWRVHDLDRGFLGENIRWLDHWRFRGLAWQLLRFLYYVVIPYGLVVQHRLITGRALGIVGADNSGFLGWSPAAWLQGAGVTVLVFMGGVILLGWSWWAVARNLSNGNVFYLHHRPPGWELVWDALFLQIHWGFYRAAAGAWLGENHLVWGVLVGLLLVGLEAAGDPGLFFAAKWPSLITGWVRLAAVAWLAAALFLVTRNLWLGVVLHWGLTWTANRVGSRLSTWSLSSRS